METKAREVYPSGPTVEVTIGFTEDEVVELFRKDWVNVGPHGRKQSYHHQGSYAVILRAAVRKIRPGAFR